MALPSSQWRCSTPGRGWAGMAANEQAGDKCPSSPRWFAQFRWSANYCPAGLEKGHQDIRFPCDGRQWAVALECPEEIGGQPLLKQKDVIFLGCPSHKTGICCVNRRRTSHPGIWLEKRRRADWKTVPDHVEQARWVRRWISGGWRTIRWYSLGEMECHPGTARICIYVLLGIVCRSSSLWRDWISYNNSCQDDCSLVIRVSQRSRPPHRVARRRNLSVSEILSCMFKWDSLLESSLLYGLRLLARQLVLSHDRLLHF